MKSESGDLLIFLPGHQEPKMHAVANLVVDVLKVERMIPLEVAATPPKKANRNCYGSGGASLNTAVPAT